MQPPGKTDRSRVSQRTFRNSPAPGTDWRSPPQLVTGGVAPAPQSPQLRLRWCCWLTLPPRCGRRRMRRAIGNRLQHALWHALVSLMTGGTGSGIDTSGKARVIERISNDSRSKPYHAADVASTLICRSGAHHRRGILSGRCGEVGGGARRAKTWARPGVRSHCRGGRDRQPEQAPEKSAALNLDIVDRTGLFHRANVLAKVPQHRNGGQA